MALTKITSDGITNATIVNADINESAAIAGTKVSPNFGSQNVVTSGTLGSSDVTITGSQPSIKFIDDGNNPDYNLYNNNGVLRLYDIINAADRLVVNTDGHIDVTGNLDVGAGLDVTGNITVSGTVDGVDIAALNTTVSGKLSNIVEDTTPQLGGDLDMNSKSISSGILGIKNTGSQSEVRLYCEVSNAHYIAIKAPPHAQFSGNPVFQLPPNGGTNGYFLKTNGSGVTSWAAVTTDLVNDTSPQLGGDLDSNGNNITLDDNDRIRLGAGNRLDIYHDSSSGNSFIKETGSGSLVINANDFFVQNVATETMIKAVSDGAVELYHDSSKKFETVSNGNKAHGHYFADDGNKIQLGTSQDLQIFHDGSNSYIEDAGTGDLRITASQIVLANTSFTENMLTATQDGAVSLFNNGVKKFETTSSGIGITGNATSSVSSLTDGANITVDLSSASHFTVTLGGNRTFVNSGMNTSNSIGSSGSIFIVQDGTGSRTAAFQSAYKFAGGTAPTLSTAANAVDRLDFIVRAADNVHCVVTLDVK